MEAERDWFGEAVEAVLKEWRAAGPLHDSCLGKDGDEREAAEAAFILANEELLTNAATDRMVATAIADHVRSDPRFNSSDGSVVDAEVAARFGSWAEMRSEYLAFGNDRVESHELATEAFLQGVTEPPTSAPAMPSFGPTLSHDSWRLRLGWPRLETRFKVENKTGKDILVFLSEARTNVVAESSWGLKLGVAAYATVEFNRTIKNTPTTEKATPLKLNISARGEAPKPAVEYGAGIYRFSLCDKRSVATAAHKEVKAWAYLTDDTYWPLWGRTKTITYEPRDLDRTELGYIFTAKDTLMP